MHCLRLPFSRLISLTRLPFLRMVGLIDERVASATRAIKIRALQGFCSAQRYRCAERLGGARWQTKVKAD